MYIARSFFGPQRTRDRRKLSKRKVLCDKKGNTAVEMLFIAISIGRFKQSVASWLWQRCLN
jgi:hypothetical protein